MIEIAHTIQLILPVFYGLLLGGCLANFLRPDFGKKWLLPYIGLILLFHATYIGIYTRESGHCLMTTSHELFSLIAFTILTTYTIVELRPREFSAGTATMVALVSFSFQLVSSLSSDISNNHSNPLFSDPIFNIHVTTAVFGYAALTLATVYGSLYLLLYRSMSNNSFGTVYRGLPSLQRLERFGVRSSAVGFIFLTLSIIFGALLVGQTLPLSQGAAYLFDPKTIATVLTWLVFGTTILLRRFAKIEGRKLVIYWMTGFALIVISMTIINAVGTEYHSFL
ncbi:MAG: cytochrome c biogenesis protein CcsA [bacterium]